MNSLFTKISIFLVIFYTTNGEFCLPMLKNYGEVKLAMRMPARIRKWIANIQDFVLLEALERGGELVCSVDYITHDNLEGRTLVVAVETMYPYVLVDGNYTTVSGYIGDIWTSLEKALNFTSNFTKPGASAVETLMKGTTDVWLVAKALNSYTAGHYSYSYQIATNSYSLFALSEGTRVSIWWYANIFSAGLWAMTLLFLIGITCMLLAMYRIKKATCQNYVECHDELDAVSLDLLCVLGGITGQGIQMMPSSLSLRILMITSLMMGLLISGGFSGTLTSYLASRGSFVPLTSLHDVAQKKTHSLCVRNNSGAYNNLVDPGLGLGLVAKGLINTGNCPDMRDGKNLGQQLCRSGIIYMEAPDVFISAYRQSQHRCRIIQLPSNYWGFRIAFLLARSSPYRQVIDKYLMRLHSSGIFNYVERKWISRELLDDVQQKFDFQPVEYGHIIIIFLGLCVMLLISAFICILEIIWHRLGSKCEKNRKIERRLKILKKLSHQGHFPKKLYINDKNYQ